MFNRIPIRILRPWISRPRGIAFLVAVGIAFATSSAYAQRGGGCGGSGGMSGMGSTGTFGGNGVSGGFGGNGGFGSNGGFSGVGGMGGTGGGNLGLMMLGGNEMQQMQQFQAMYGEQDSILSHQEELRARKAFRAALTEQRKQRQSWRKEKLSKQVATRVKSYKSSSAW